MTSTKQVETNKANKSKLKETSSNGNDVIVPDWVNEDHFIDVLEENVKGFKKILKFEAGQTGGAGENYASIMMRVKIRVQLEDGAQKDVAFMIKTIPQGEQGAAMVSMMGLFPKEIAMYGKYLREFEQMYCNVGKQITFGPKFYTLKKDPGAEYVLLEDLSPAGFKNVNRLEGLNREYTESVLKLLAELHAVSAVRYETKGAYDESLMTGMFTPSNRDQMEAMMKPMRKNIIESVAKLKDGAKYSEKIKIVFENFVDDLIELSLPKENDFNVVTHGDLWANNIMFRHNDEGKRQQTIFVDFQMSRYTTPAFDLYYFLLSSTSLDIKMSLFDDLVKFYHDHLVENLRLLKYSRPLPTLKQLRMDLLKFSKWSVSTVTGIMAAVLLDPTENANIENFFEGEKRNSFLNQLLENPRYVKHMDALLPWMDARGLLDN